MAKLKAWSEAGSAAGLAEQRGEDRASAAYQSSIIAILNGDAPGAQAEADKAIELAPNWYKPHLLKAQLLQATGKNAEASEEARVSLNLGWKGK
jgi:Tfp pilus assembly protein PilF